MRIPLVYVVSAALLLASSCSRDKPATPATPPAPAPTAATTPAAAAAAPAAAPKQQVFGVEELDQMVAPIALYPDPLLAQVLMAATYPGDVAEAAAWAKANPSANGDAAVRQVATQPWDPSVQSLVAVPQALATLGQDPPWVQRLGDAFLAQPDDVMDAIQRLRHKAQSAGNLASNEYQKVRVEPAAPAAQAAPEPAMGSVESYPAPVSNETIIIESADPQTVYVPSYDPNTAYGQWDYPSYPPSYYPPPQSYYPMGGMLATGLAWGVGFAVADSLWGDADWDNGDIDIDVDRYNNINSNRQIDRSQSNWNHNGANRDGVPYRDQGNRDRNNRRLDGAENRSEFRGEDANRARSRDQARQSMERRGVDTPARSNQEARDRAQSASRDQARQRADATNRERAQADRSRQQADRTRGDRAQADRSRQQQASRQQADRSRAQAQSRDRAQASQRQQQASRDSSRRQQETRHRQSQSNTQARSQARQQQSRQAPRNDAFQGASRPQQSRQSAQRGQQSHASAQRGGSRGGGGGQQAQRSAPQRQSRR
jgi:hypothetical protein